MDEVVVRPTELEALANVQAVLQLCSAGKLKCSEKTGRPSAATVTAVAAALQDGCGCRSSLLRRLFLPVAPIRLDEPNPGTQWGATGPVRVVD
jgi:hypothetical protein